jgi:PAS domain S-box-containing protein
MIENPAKENTSLGFEAAQGANENSILGERLSFEQLLSDLSARFIQIAVERLDTEIERALKTILDFFQVDRCGLLQVLPSTGVWMITHVAYSQNVPTVPKKVQLPASINPWAYERLVSERKAVVFARIDEVPPEAAVDKKTWAEWGIRSNLVIPIFTSESVTHVIAINSVRSEHNWREEFIPRLQLLGEIFVNSLERKRVQLKLDQALRFQKMLSALSAKFANLPSSQVNVEIEKGLGQIARIFDLDRCVMARLTNDKSRTVATHSWVASGVEPVPEVVDNERIPWVVGKILRSEPAFIADVEELPEDAAEDRSFFNQVGIRSALYLPLAIGGAVIGILGVASLHSGKLWPEELAEGLQMAADIFSNALARQEKDRALQAAERKYRTILDFTYDWEYWENLDGSIRYSSPSCKRITGWPPQAFAQDPQKLRSLICPEDRAEWDDHFYRIRHSASPHELQFRIKHRDGEIRWIEHACRPVTDENGNLIAIRASNRDITRRMQTQEAIRQREMELQSLTGRLILGQEEERRRLARELHDDLSQRLAALAIEAGKTETEVKDKQDPIRKSLSALRDQAIRIAADVHDISRRLHPSILEDLGLRRAIESECTRFSAREGVDVAFSAENIPGGLPQDVSLSIYRIVQEGLSNIAKHACARRVTVALSASEVGLHLSIRDDGLGFDAVEARKKPGLGLSSIRERVRLVNGKHRIGSEPEKGTVIDVTVPLQPKVSKEESGALSEGLA